MTSLRCLTSILGHSSARRDRRQLNRPLRSLPKRRLCSTRTLDPLYLSDRARETTLVIRSLLFSKIGLLHLTTVREFIDLRTPWRMLLSCHLLETLHGCHQIFRARHRLDHLKAFTNNPQWFERRRNQSSKRRLSGQPHMTGQALVKRYALLSIRLRRMSRLSLLSYVVLALMFLLLPSALEEAETHRTALIARRGFPLHLTSIQRDMILLQEACLPSNLHLSTARRLRCERSLRSQVSHLLWPLVQVR